MAHVAEWKKEEVNELKGLIESAEVVGIVNLLNIPARQLQEMRKTLAGKATIRLSKINLMKLALEDCDAEKANITGLSDYMEGQPALVCTDMNPFRLYKILEDSKTSAPAKAGATAPEDIVVPAGDTGFPPGPFLGDLQQIGVPAKIDKGKIVVSKDTVVVEAGEEVSKQVAATLARMDINPMEVGIDLKAVYEDEAVIAANPGTIIESTVRVYELLGAEVYLYFDYAGANFTARVKPTTTARTGDTVKLALEPSKIHIFDKETEMAITH